MSHSIIYFGTKAKHFLLLGQLMHAREINVGSFNAATQTYAYKTIKLHSKFMIHAGTLSTIVVKL